MKSLFQINTAVVFMMHIFLMMNKQMAHAAKSGCVVVCVGNQTDAESEILVRYLRHAEDQLCGYYYAPKKKKNEGGGFDLVNGLSSMNNGLEDSVDCSVSVNAKHYSDYVDMVYALLNQAISCGWINSCAGSIQEQDHKCSDTYLTNYSSSVWERELGEDTPCSKKERYEDVEKWCNYSTVSVRTSSPLTSTNISDFTDLLDEGISSWRGEFGDCFRSRLAGIIIGSFFGGSFLLLFAYVFLNLPTKIENREENTSRNEERSNDVITVQNDTKEDSGAVVINRSAFFSDTTNHSSSREIELSDVTSIEQLSDNPVLLTQTEHDSVNKFEPLRSVV